MLELINFKELSKINDEKLLKLVNKAYKLADQDQVDEIALHHLIGEVSKRHYGIEVVNNNKANDEYLCFDNGKFIKIVKKQSAMKFIRFGEVGYSALPIVAIRSIQGDDKGNIMFFA